MTKFRRRSEGWKLMGFQRGVILLKVLEYLAYKVQYADFNTEDIIEDFSERIDPYIALELYVTHTFSLSLAYMYICVFGPAKLIGIVG